METDQDELENQLKIIAESIGVENPNIVVSPSPSCNWIIQTCSACDENEIENCLNGYAGRSYTPEGCRAPGALFQMYSQNQ